MSRERRLERSGRGERSSSLEEILARKRELIGRCADQRDAVATHAVGLGSAFAAGDKVVGVGRSILSRPLVLVGIGALLLVLWPRAIFSVATRGFALWNGVAAFRRLIAERK
jgi:hypothetical protein